MNYIRIWKDVSYQTPPTWNPVPQLTSNKDRSSSRLLDLYFPSSRTPSPWPVVLYFHGGMWAFGSKDDAICSQVGKQLARGGCVGVVVSYRLYNFHRTELVKWTVLLTFLLVFSFLMATTVWRQVFWSFALIHIWLLWFYTEMSFTKDRNMHPAGRNDCLAGLRWIRALFGPHAAIHLLGHSAGAHLASLVVCSQPNHRVSSVIAWSGVYSAAEMKRKAIPRKIAALVFGLPDRRWENAFPVEILGKVTHPLPPFQLWNAQYESGFQGHTREWKRALEKHGTYYEHQVLQNKSNHLTGMNIWWEPLTHPVLEQVFQWIGRFSI